MQVENDNVLVGYLPATTTVSLDQNHEVGTNRHVHYAYLEKRRLVPVYPFFGSGSQDFGSSCHAAAKMENAVAKTGNVVARLQVFIQLLHFFPDLTF